MKYTDIRDQIRDGDLIAVRSNHRGLPALTRFFTRSPYTHTAVAIWLDGGLWAAEMNAGGNALVPLSRWANTDFDVFSCPVDPVAVREMVLETLREKIDYDLLDLLLIAAHSALHFKLPTDTGGLVCSAYSAKIYTMCGWRAPFLPSIPAPSDVVEAITGYPQPGCPPRFEMRQS